MRMEKRAIWSFHGAGFIVLAASMTALRLEHCRSSFMLVVGVLARALPEGPARAEVKSHEF
jgi:hypothetical protein